MSDNFFNNMQFNDIQVIKLQLDTNDFTPILYLRVLVMDTLYSLKFTNVSSLNIRDFSLPFQIQGFEIVSNKSKGWDNSLTYSVRDYEDDKISFYCEDVYLM